MHTRQKRRNFAFGVNVNITSELFGSYLKQATLAGLFNRMLQDFEFENTTSLT